MQIQLCEKSWKAEYTCLIRVVHCASSLDKNKMWNPFLKITKGPRTCIWKTISSLASLSPTNCGNNNNDLPTQILVFFLTKTKRKENNSNKNKILNSNDRPKLKFWNGQTTLKIWTQNKKSKTIQIKIKTFAIVEPEKGKKKYEIEKRRIRKISNTWKL